MATFVTPTIEFFTSVAVLPPETPSPTPFPQISIPPFQNSTVSNQATTEVGSLEESKSPSPSLSTSQLRSSTSGNSAASIFTFTAGGHPVVATKGLNNAVLLNSQTLSPGATASVNGQIIQIQSSTQAASNSLGSPLPAPQASDHRGSGGLPPAPVAVIVGNTETIPLPGPLPTTTPPKSSRTVLLEIASVVPGSNGAGKVIFGSGTLFPGEVTVLNSETLSYAQQEKTVNATATKTSVAAAAAGSVSSSEAVGNVTIVENGPNFTSVRMIAPGAPETIVATTIEVAVQTATTVSTAVVDGGTVTTPQTQETSGSAYSSEAGTSRPFASNSGLWSACVVLFAAGAGLTGG